MNEGEIENGFSQHKREIHYRLDKNDKEHTEMWKEINDNSRSVASIKSELRTMVIMASALGTGVGSIIAAVIGLIARK